MQYLFKVSGYWSTEYLCNTFLNFPISFLQTCNLRYNFILFKQHLVKRLWMPKPVHKATKICFEGLPLHSRSKKILHFSSGRVILEKNRLKNITRKWIIHKLHLSDIEKILRILLFIFFVDGKQYGCLTLFYIYSELFISIFYNKRFLFAWMLAADNDQFQTESYLYEIRRL